MVTEDFSHKVKVLTASAKATTAQLDQWLYELHLRIEKLENDTKLKDMTIDNLKKELAEEKLKTENMSASIETLNTKTSTTFNLTDLNKRDEKNKLPKQTLNLINIFSDSQDEIKRKENNIIINGIKEDGGNEDEISKSAKEMVDSLIKETRIKVTIMKYARLGKKKEGNNKDRPILITLSDKEQVLPILKAFNQLKDDTKHKTFI